MLNMLDTQDKLKNFSEAQLIKEMQMPSGSAPQFMVLSEIERRKRMRSDAQRQEGLMQPTVAQEAVSAAGVPQQGIAQVAQSMAPKTDMTQNTGVPNVQAAGLPAQPNQPQRMADGGVLRLAPGGSMSGGSLSAIANLKVMRPDLYEQHKDNPEMLALTAEYYLTVADDPEMTSLEAMSAPRENDLIKRMFSDPTNRDVSKQRGKDAAEFGDDYALDQRGLSLGRSRPTDANDPLFAEGAPVEYVGGTSVPTPGGIVGGSMFSAPELLETDDTSRPYFPIAPQFDGIQLPSAVNQRKTPSGFGENPMPAPGIGGLPTESIASIDEESSRDAVRKFLGDRILPAIDQPVRLKAVRDMIQSAEDFQNSDTSVPREQIYNLNSPLDLSRYEEASGEEFTSTADRLAQEQFEQENRMSEASLDAQNVTSDTQRIVDRVFDQKMRGNQGEFTGAERLRNNLFEYGLGRDTALRKMMTPPNQTTGDPLQAGGISELMPPKTEAQLAAEAKKIADKVVDANKPAGGGKGSGKTSSGSGQGRIADLIADRKKQGDQDKWLALAQAGLSLMSSGDFGKAGQQGLAALMAQRAQMNKFDTDMLKLESDLALNNARIAAARNKSTGSGLTANQLLTRGNDLIKSGQTMLENAGDNADDAAEAQLLISAGRELIRRVTGGPAAAASSVIRTPSANQTG